MVSNHRPDIPPGYFMSVKLLLSSRRSGSHFLKSFIEAHFLRVICSGEILSESGPLTYQHPALSNQPEFPHFWSWYESEALAGKISVAPSKRIEAFESYLAKLSEQVGSNDLVIDIKYDSVRSLSGYLDSDYGSHDFTSFITSRKIPVVHLIRENILKVIISHKLAAQTGIWHRTKDRSPDEALPKIRLNPKSVISEIGYCLKLAEDYRSRFNGYADYHEVIYEDLVEEQHSLETGGNVRTLGRFLGRKPIDSSHAPLPFKKTTPDDPSEVVENWNEVSRTLQSTEYGWMVLNPYLAAA
jgi:hypothetical protein